MQQQSIWQASQMAAILTHCFPRIISRYQCKTTALLVTWMCQSKQRRTTPWPCMRSAWQA